MTAVVVLGAGGMLGHDLMEVLSAGSVRGYVRAEVDITNRVQVLGAIDGAHTVINAAAYTRVDDAESEEDVAFQVNAVGAGVVASACSELGSRLIHVSTDYVFDGQAAVPYQEDHARNPQTAYGRTKAAGEEQVLANNADNSIIIRTAWLYGEHGPNFVATMLSLAKNRDTVSVVTDQVGQPTWSRDLAHMIRVLVDSPITRGIFHGTNAGEASWWDFARTIFTSAGLDLDRVVPTTSEAFVRPAQRPAWSVLGHKQWAAHGLPAPRAWAEAFDEAWTDVFSGKAVA